MFRELPSRTPEGPRPITPDMEADAANAGRFPRIFGALWAGIWWAVSIVLGVVSTTVTMPVGGLLCLMGLGMGAVGALLYALGAWQRRRALELFRIGEEVRGEVLSVDLDLSQRINRVHPWRVRYGFEADGRAHEGATTFWTPTRPDVEVGMPVVVLFAPGRPSRWGRKRPQTPAPYGRPARSVLWTRVAAGDEAAPRVRVGAVSDSAVSRAEEESAEDEALEISPAKSRSTDR